jgi:hypothetical protein
MLQMVRKVLSNLSKILSLYEYKWQKMLYLKCCLNLLITERNGDLSRFTLQYEQDYVLSGPRQSSIMFSFIGF